jgi:predicted DNA-binding transcriptional regulator YafY
MTTGELAAHFEVSSRTILRDIDVLTTAGIPIYTLQGKGGGIYIHDRYVLNKAVISENEQKQILFALQGMSATQHTETESILSKLRSLFKKADKDWIEVDFSRWGNSAADRDKFASLKNAIISEQTVSFNYSSSYCETADRKVCPLKLVFKSKSWYLQAFCLLKNDYRTFKINRMRNVKILADTFDGKMFHIPEIESSEYQSPSLVDVKLHFVPQAAYRVYDEFDEQNIIKSEDGSLIVSMSMPNEFWLYSYILSFGESIEVLEPQSVRDEIARQAEKIKSKYANKK